MWMRGTIGDLAQHVGTTLLGVLIMLCAIMALIRAVARDIAAHRRWALRLYIVVSAALFIRAGFTLGALLAQGVAGIDPSTLSGGFLTFMSFAQYLVPLAVLELYFQVQSRGGTAARLAMAGGLFTLTLLLGAGVAAASVAIWVPAIKVAIDSRISIVDPLAETIAASGAEAAIRQYQGFKTRPAGLYNFDENELNILGYTLIRAHRFKDAIAILQLNVTAYPASANTYDSLGEAYMDDGDHAQAIANYRASLRLNPANGNAAAMLAKLGGG
jgi:tetratricopeptide (TPR) repeat protein